MKDLKSSIVNPQSKIFFTFLLLLPFNLFFFPWRHDWMVKQSGMQMPAIDVWFAYRPERVYAALQAFGEQGRQFYAVTELSLDLAYPVLYSALLYGLLAWLLPIAVKASSPLQKLRRLPILVFLADILENTCLVILLLSYPARLEPLAWAASFFTSLKWITGCLSLALVLYATTRAFLPHPKPPSLA